MHRPFLNVRHRYDPVTRELHSGGSDNLPDARDPGRCAPFDRPG